MKAEADVQLHAVLKEKAYGRRGGIKVLQFERGLAEVFPDLDAGVPSMYIEEWNYCLDSLINSMDGLEFTSSSFVAFLKKQEKQLLNSDGSFNLDVSYWCSIAGHLGEQFLLTLLGPFLSSLHKQPIGVEVPNLPHINTYKL